MTLNPEGSRLESFPEGLGDGHRAGWSYQHESAVSVGALVTTRAEARAGAPRHQACGRGCPPARPPPAWPRSQAVS